MSGFANNHDENAGSAREVDAGLRKNQTRAVPSESELSLHHRWNVDGFQGVQENLPRKLFRGNHGANDRRSGLLEQIRVEQVWRTLAFEEGNNIVRGHNRHFERVSMEAEAW